jgi:hypothetical protein
MTFDTYPVSEDSSKNMELFHRRKSFRSNFQQKWTKHVMKEMK